MGTGSGCVEAFLLGHAEIIADQQAQGLVAGNLQSHIRHVAQQISTCRIHQIQAIRQDRAINTMVFA